MDDVQISEETGHSPRRSQQVVEDVRRKPEPDVHKKHRLQVRNLTKELEDPDKAERLKLQFSNVQLSWYEKAQLELIRTCEGNRTITETIRSLRRFYETREPILPIASPDLVFSDDIPVQVSGPSGSGKSTFAQKLVTSQPGPTLVIDVAAEFSGLKRITLSDFFALKWKRLGPETRLRFCPSTDPEVAKSEIRTVFSFLNRTKVVGHRPGKTPSGILSQMIFVTEEGHRLHRELVFLNWLAESRKFIRKNIVIASDPSLFASICRVMRPPPITETRQ